MRWFILIALGVSADFIRQYTLLTGTRDTVRASIEQDKKSARAEKENCYILVKSQSKDIPMKKGRPILRCCVRSAALFLFYMICLTVGGLLDLNFKKFRSKRRKNHATAD